jgi:hypothetical protein
VVKEKNAAFSTAPDEKFYLQIDPSEQRPDVATQENAAAPLIVMSAVTIATFRSLNDSKTPMFVIMGAVGLNTVLGLFLVFGWGPSLN